MAYIDASSFVLTLPNAVGSITGTSTPFSISEVASLCERIGAEINGAAAEAGYVVPIPTGATIAYSQLELLSVRGVAAHMLLTIFPGGEAGGMKLADSYRAAYKEALKELKKGDYVLVGAAKDTGESNRLLPRSHSTENSTATVGVDPQVSVGDVY